MQPARRALQDWPKELPDLWRHFHLLQPRKTASASDVFVPYSPSENEVHFGVDTKMKVLERGP